MSSKPTQRYSVNKNTHINKQVSRSHSPNASRQENRRLQKSQAKKTPKSFLKQPLQPVLNLVPVHTPASSLDSASPLVLAHNQTREAPNFDSLDRNVDFGKEVIIVSNNTLHSNLAGRSSNPTRDPHSGSSQDKAQAVHPKSQETDLSSVEELNTHSLYLDLTPPSSNTHRDRIGNLEPLLEELLMNKSYNGKQLQSLDRLFDAYIGSSGELHTSTEIQKHRSTLRKIKLAYEIQFQVYGLHEKRAQEKLAEEKTEKDIENKQLKNQVQDLTERLRLLHDAKDQALGKKERGQDYFHATDTSYDRTQELVTRDRGHAGQDSPPMTRNKGQKDRERDSLRAMVLSQQAAIKGLKKKEVKLVKLLYACKKRGLDIEKIYNDEVKTFLTKEEQDTINESSDEYNLPTLSKNAEWGRQAEPMGLEANTHSFKPAAEQRESLEEVPSRHSQFETGTTF